MNQAKKLKTGGHLQVWWPSSLVPCGLNKMIMQTRVRTPKVFLFPGRSIVAICFAFFLVITAVDVCQSILLTPGRLKPATSHAWGVG